MALTKPTFLTNIITNIGTNVAERGLTTDQFKAKFDETPAAIKAYLNDVLIEEIDTVLGTKLIATDLDPIKATPIVSVTNNKTLGLTDSATVQKVNLGTPITITIPTNAVVAFSLETEIAFIRYGTGTVTFAGAGVTINSEDSKKSINRQHGTACLKKTGTDEWALFGSLAT
jgi:hypothetical protein